MSYEKKIKDTLSDADYMRQMEYDAQSNREGNYVPSILIGLGGTGTKALYHLRHLFFERYGTAVLPGMFHLAIDVDVHPPTEYHKLREVYNHREAAAIDFKRNEYINATVYLAEVMENLRQGTGEDHIREWWDPNTYDDFDLSKGAGPVRPLSRLVCFKNKDHICRAIENAHFEVTNLSVDNPRVINDGRFNVYIIAGLAGATGSGMFLDIAGMVKATLGYETNITGYLVLPDVYKNIGPEAFDKLAANGVAALRELNHYKDNHFEVDWGDGKSHRIPGLYNKVFLFTGSNLLNKPLPKVKHAYRTIGQALFLQFAGGNLPAFIDSVRINRTHFLLDRVQSTYKTYDPVKRTNLRTIAESWRTCFSGFGVSKLSYPAWRLLHYACYDLATRFIDRLIVQTKSETTPIDASSDPIISSLEELNNQFTQLRDSYRQSKDNPLFQELEVEHDYDELLHPYLGYTAEDQERRLTILSQKVMGKGGLNLTSVDALEHAILKEPKQFRDQLSAALFTALKGGPNGKTTAFVDNSDPDDEGIDGFLQRHSIMNAFSKLMHQENVLIEKLKQMFEHGLPWIADGKADMPAELHGTYYEVYSTFIGIPPGSSQELKETLIDFLQTEMEAQGLNLSIAPVETSDPTEIVFYTELHAFPVFHLGSLYKEQGLNRYYEKLIYDPNKRTPLHLHRDFQTFGRVIPLSTSELDKYKEAVKLFLEGQMIGMFQTDSKETLDAQSYNRYQFVQKSNQGGLFNYEPLGQEAKVIRDLQGPNANELAYQLYDYRNKLIGLGAKYADFCALIQYWKHCLYPVLKPQKIDDELMGTIENSMLVQLEEEYKKKSETQKEFENFETDFDNHVYSQIMNLQNWTVPIAKSKGKNFPRKKAIDPERRAIQWGQDEWLVEAIEDKLHAYIEDGWIHRESISYGDKVFPRLAVDWDKYQPLSYQLNMNGRFNRHLTFEQLIKTIERELEDAQENNTAYEVVTDINQGRYKAQTKHLEDFTDIRDVEEIWEKVKDLLSSITAERSSDEPPPRPPPEERIWYTPDRKERIEILPSEIAQRYANDPNPHIYLHGKWTTNLKEHPSLAAWIDELEKSGPKPTDDPAIWYTPDRKERIQIPTSNIAQRYANDPNPHIHLHGKWTTNLKKHPSLATWIYYFEAPPPLEDGPPPLEDGPPPLDDDIFG